METEDRGYWQWFCSSFFSEPGLEHRLLERYGSPREVFERKTEELTEAFAGNTAKLASVCREREKWDFTGEKERLERLGIRFVTREDAEYPRRLWDISDAPYGLFFRGELPPEKLPAVAVIGARDCSSYGKNIALWFAGELAQAGTAILGGMARGIDAWGHRGALAAGGKTYAVLGSGADVCYPEENRDIYMELEKRGGLISECPPGTRPLRHLFPLRNRILSGLADVVLIIEARKKSGSLITADCALEQGREIYAVPGPLGETLSEGCHNLIRQGAGLAVSPEKLLEDLEIFPGIHMKKMQKNKITLERSENLVYSCLSFQAQNLDSICRKTGLSPSEALGALGKLQIRGYVQESFKNYYSVWKQ